MTTMTGTDARAREIPDEAIEQLRSAIGGRLLRPADPGYDEARTIWNAMIDRRPQLIIQCTAAEDVVRAVEFARANEVLLAVRGGGHNIAGHAMCDGGVVIDLSPMKAIRVEPERRRAEVEPGATLGDFDAEAQAHGLATPLGINSTTGVAGLTLGGGFGWLSRRYGMTVDNLLAADVVLADGRTVTCSAEEHTDLFWAIRGGGGNFGIVTRFEFQLHPVGPEVLSGLIVYPFHEAATVLRRYREFLAKAPDELNVWAVLRKAPPLPFLPESVHGTEVLALAICHAGDPEEGARLVEPLRSFGTIVGEHVGAMPYTAWQQAFDPLLTPGARNYWKSHNLARLEDGAIDAAIEYVAKLPSPQCEVFFGAIGGATTRVSPDATAWSHRDAAYVMNVHGRWEDPEQDEACIAWAREFTKATAAYATGGVYVNFLTEEETDRIAAAYGPNYQRLAEVKRKYDPSNLFRHNQNIAPSAPRP
jgi:FAD/FMN-containing dehydrogenase